MRKRATYFVKLLIFTLLTLSVGRLQAQIGGINLTSTPSAAHFASEDFKGGTLSVSFNMPPGKNTAEVALTFPTGIEYFAGSVTKGANVNTVVQKTGSTTVNPVFTVTSTSPGATVTFTITRKVTKAALVNLKNGTILKDNATVTVTGVGTTTKQADAAYTLPYPSLAVQNVPPTQSNAQGTHTVSFDVRNTGDGSVKDIYFSIKYPADVVAGGVTYGGNTLTKIGQVPTGFDNAGADLYKVTLATALVKNAAATFSHTYTVNKCTAGRTIDYVAYWGNGISELFEASPKVTKTLNIATGTPRIGWDYTNSNNTYFTWADGLSGNTIGTYTVRYINDGTGDNPTAFNIRIKVFERHRNRQFIEYQPTKFRLVATDGTEIMIPASAITQPVADKDITINFDNMPELSATHPTYGSKTIGLTDENNDGRRNELKKGNSFTLRFDYVKKAGIRCLQTNGGEFIVNPCSEMYSKNVCGQDGTAGGAYIHERTFERFVNGIVDGVKLPTQLIENVLIPGYMIADFNTSGYNNRQRLKGGASDSVENDRRYKYEMKLPAGVALKNVKFYKAWKYGTATLPPEVLSDVPAGGTFTYTTGTTAYGYITFDMVLENCIGTGNVKVDYKISYLDKDGGKTTYSEVPYVCVTQKEIPTACSLPCSNNGPRMTSTKVERADNSYGWKDYTMAVRQTRAQVSPLQRQRALYLDDIEVISEGKELGAATSNLYYHATFAKAPGLKAKSLKFTVGSHTVTLPATAVTKTTVGDKDYFLWNLTSALPGGSLPKDATFNVVATYQITNNNDARGNNSHDIESGGESFFYRLDNPATETALTPEGYHTAQKHCGANLYATFYYANLFNHLNTNAYYVDGCALANIGSSFQVFAGRRFDAGGNYFTDEFRPSRLIKKVTFQIPSSMNYIGSVVYRYRQKYGTEAEKSVNFTLESDNGTYKTYTYTNPTSRTDPGYLPAGEISVENFYDSYFKTTLQATCKTPELNSFALSEANNMMVKSKIEYEDFYYHYAISGDKKEVTYEMPKGLTAVYHRYKPAITMATVSASSINANKRELEAKFTISNGSLSDAPYGWVSVPDVTGIEVISLQETTAGSAFTYTDKGISGEKMFFLKDNNNKDKIEKGKTRSFTLKYRITGCENTNLKVYAGWNCNENPTQGYKSTCHEQSLTYAITVPRSRRDISPDAANPTQIDMCQKATYSYTINSAGAGDLYNVKLVVNEVANTLSFSDVTVQYPLGGTTYTVGTGAGHILHTQQGTKHIYDLSNVLPGGSLAGNLSEPIDANKRQLKLTFKVEPKCDFTSGSEFDIDVESTDLCGRLADGDKTKAIVAGIKNVTAVNYDIGLTPLTLVPGGNASACASGATYKTRVTVNQKNATFTEIGPNARLRFRIPEGYELLTLGMVSRTPAYNPPTVTWANPVEKIAERRTIGNETEIVITIPKGMKNNDSFEYSVTIRQKANTLVECTAKKLKVFSTDATTGASCGGTPCPATIANTSNSGTKEIVIDNNRPKPSFTDVRATSVAKNGKEELTIAYKVANASDAGVALSATMHNLKIDLYKDNNNDGQYDAGDTKLNPASYSFVENVAQGGTSTEKSFTIEVAQADVCRLLLVMRNEENVCLCSSVAAGVPAPEEITGLVDNLTVCENETKQLVYKAAGATYDQYTWSGKTPNDKLDYLSAANVKEPNFHYNGTKLTATQTFTYKLTVKRTNGCEATQEVTVTVTPQTAAPDDKEVLFCQGDTYNIGTLKAKIRTELSLPGTTVIKFYDASDSNLTTELVDATAIVRNAYYVFTLTNSGQCVSEGVKAYVKGITPPTVANANQSFCGAATVADLQPQGTNYVWYAAAIGGTALTPTTALADNTLYYVAKKNGSCESERVSVKTRILQAPATGQSYTFCKGATVYDLKKKVDPTRPESVRVYHNGNRLTGDNERLPQTGTFKVSHYTNSCETSLVDVGVAFTTVEFTSLTANPTFLPQAGGSVTFTIKGTPGATVSYTIGTETGTKVLDGSGEATVTKSTTEPIALTVTKIEKGGCELVLSQTLLVGKACGNDVPEPQFDEQKISYKTMNGVMVKREVSGLLSRAYFTPALSSSLTCKPSYTAGYVHMHSTKSTKVVYTFAEPITSVDVSLLMMGERTFIFDYYDRAEFEVNCGVLRLDIENDCNGNATKEGYTIKTKRLDDVVVRVSSNKPFTTLTIRPNNDLITDGFAMELCPSSVKKADLLHVITQPQPTAVCEGSTARFTSKVQLKAGLLGQIGYQWQVSADQTSWSDVGTTRYANSDEEVELLVPNTTVSQHNDRYYRVRYTYERTAAICDAKVTEYSQTAKLTVYGKAEVTKLTANPGSIAQGVSTPVTFAFKGTPGATVVYTVAGGAPAEITLDANGEATQVFTISQATTLAIVQVKKGDCTYPSSQKIEVTAGCGTSKPEPQFATGLNVKKTMNGVEVTRDLDGNISYSPVDNDPAYCNGPFEAGYVWMGRNLNPLPTNLTTKTTYHFDTPVTSAEIWFMGMGKSGFVNQNFTERATITVNCGTAQVTRVSDCRDNSSDTYSKVINGNEVEGKGLTDMVVRVTSDKPFTRIVIEDGNSNGSSDPAASGYYVELCPSSIQKAEILSVEQDPQSENHCEGDTTAFTAKAQLETGYTGQIAYQWQSSTDALTWTDMAGKSGNTASGTAQVLGLVTTRSMDDTWYRVKYTYTEATPSRLCNGVTVTRYSEAAKLNVTGVDKPILIEVSAADCIHDRVMKITNVDTNAIYSFVRTSDNASVNGVVGSNGEISALPAGKYKVTATKNNCSSEASDEFEIIAAKGSVIPVVQEKTFATCDEASTAKITNYVPGTTYHFEKADGTAVTDPITVDATDGTITGLAVGKYKVKGEKDGCTSDASAVFEIKDKLVPAAPTVAKVSDPTCDDPTIVKITNYIEGGSYTFVKTADNTEITTGFTIDQNSGKVTGLAAAKYKVKVKVNECTSALSDEFEVKAKKPTPDKPTIDLTAESCTAATVAKISNYDSGITYTFTKADGTPVTSVTIATDGVLSGLAAGTYKVKAEKDGCISDISDSFEIKAQKAVPAQPTVTLTAESCTAPTKAVISNYVSGQTYWNGVTQLTVDGTSHEITNLAVGTYTITAKNNDNCESVASDSFVIKAQKAVPAQPTVTLTAESCTAPTKAVISNYVSGQTYWNGVTQLTVDGTSHEITNLAVGTYTITAKNNDNCESVASDSFVIKDQKAVPAQPTVTLTAESCAAPTKAVISNYVPGQTYWNGATQLTVDGTSHEITGLAAGTYTITTKIGNCESVASDSFVIKAQKAATIIGANPQSATYVKDTSATPLTATATGEGTLTYKWYKNTTNSYTGGTEVGGNNNTYTPVTDTVGSLFYWAEITGECGTEKTSIAEIKVTAPDANHTIEANDDPETQVAKGGEVDVLHNDKVDGNPATPTNVDITIPIDGGLAGITINPATGKIKVPDNATPRTYEVEYRICVKGATSPCDTAKVKIIVTEDVVPTPTINANDDPETQVAKGGVVDVLNNDRVNGDPATAANVDITIANEGGLTGVTADPATGKIKVPDNATPGTYEVEYRICVKGATSPCDTAKVKITVTPDTTPSRPIKAVDDEFGKVPNTVDYTTTNTVFSTGVDTLEGVPGTLSPETDVILHKGAVTRQDGTAVQDGTVTMNDNGSITVKKGTPVGVYTYTYFICEKAVPTNCSEEAKATFEVVDNTILAKDDVFEMGTLGGLTPSVLNNDIFAGKVGLTTNEVIIEPTLSERNDDPKLNMRFIDGRIDVEKGIALGEHKYYYTISDKNDKTKSSPAVVTIRVVSFAAGDDEHEVFNNNGTEQHIDKPNIFDNDEVDGKTPKPGDNVTFTSTPVQDKDGKEVPGIVINPQDGTITVASGTPDGVYTYSYTICKTVAPNECKTAKGVLKLLPALEANGDDFTATPVNTTKGAVIVGNVLENDLYAGGKALDNLDKVTASIRNNGGLSGVKIDEQGNLIIPQGAPVGVYDNIEYNLCMKDHPGACKTAKIKVEVIKDKPLTIYNGVSADGDGQNDYFKIDGIEYYPKNNLKIFNRWGVLVYEKDGYTNREPFDGHSNGRATISADSKLPQGTYYYILEYEDSNDQSHTEKGWLYLKY
ncbi:gliding motility-associated C-terminal domain-containing protein [Capnocytophaga granulosa]|uniref:T9SS type B sorting domain-containing protein n=1 Tax=Capnocytophaga granulosa TaxID=45242 RepID=UPI0028E77C3C|nr:gliding motility-associated C-terminal domain-containing protein [Capnocytophaga granulosa]